MPRRTAPPAPPLSTTDPSARLRAAAPRERGPRQTGAVRSALAGAGRWGRTTRRALAAVLAAVLIAPLAACGSGSGGDPNRVDVVAAFYPLQYVAQRVGGGDVALTALTKPGVEPHDMELTPNQVGQVSEAELVLYLKGFQPAVDDAVDLNGGKDRVLDVSTTVPLLAATDGGHDHEGGSEEASGREENATRDPHLWLDPLRLATIGDAVAARLSAADPDRKADYTRRAAGLRSDLETLDKEYATGLATCQRRELVVSHAAFGYLTERYKLEQIGLSGLSPEQEPSPRRLAEVVEEARKHQATTIFFETLVSPKVAETIAREVGAETAVLDPLEGLRPGSDGDYLSVMRDNLKVLRPALGCA